ncbi:MAG: chromosome segregation protein SMC [Arenicellales bacterium]|nr:chromosome segregation protein SMC [Arenicellales bacterium]
MHLKHIKLAGFKSFVDPTTVSVPSKVVGVVGPNGCGKSNVIDAVRWVMGESSAKTLRGDSMADVIFNGSSARKPVGKAMVELVFDNSQGKAPGPYAKYNEIAIRRELSRDGQSNYFINKVRCRRRDITDIFLGTGLGPRSYSIIEQGMVGRIIEARPEELRALIEEAAGVSKYKDRRRETETRIRHTKENLDRVADIRSELETQLRRLKRQSSAAERYKKLKIEERLLRAQLMSLRWRNLDAEAGEQDRKLASLQNALDAKLAEQRADEKIIEQLRQKQSQTNEQFNKVQAEFYEVGGEIASVEQEIEHARQTRTQQQQEFERVADSYKETSQHLESDRRRLKDIEQKRGQIAPGLESAKELLASVLEEQQETEKELNEWQTQWERFSSQSAKPEQEKQVQRTRIEEHESQLANMKSREDRLQETLEKLEAQVDNETLKQLRAEAREHDELCEKIAKQVDDLDRRIGETRNIVEEISEQENEARDQYHALTARLSSLKELQAAALGQHDAKLIEWMSVSGLDEAQRLATELVVESGWERAVDRVLGARSGAICVKDLDSISVTEATEVDAYLIEHSSNSPTKNDRPSLADKVNCKSIDLSNWLSDVYIANDYDSALSMRHSLGAHESVVTADGIWVGNNWVALANRSDSNAGILAREKAIEGLEQELEQSSDALSELTRRLEGEQEKLVALEEEHADQRRSLTSETKLRAEIHNRLGRMEARALELTTRREQVESELKELRDQIQQTFDTLTNAQGMLRGAELATEDFAQLQGELTAARDQFKEQLHINNAKAVQAREALHTVQAENQRLETEWSAIKENIQRLENQYAGIVERRQQLTSILSQDEEPATDLKSRLEDLLGQRVSVEQRLTAARTEVERLDESIRETEQKRVTHEQDAQSVRGEIETERVARQEVVVRRDTLGEQISEVGHDPRQLLQEMPEDAEEADWQESVDKITKRIDRIGPVNLVAIEEYEEQAERKVYLDKQHADLSEALATLESVIQKIDRETKVRFKETFENLNVRFQQFFPRLFGGGSAYLELTGTDLLETGVAVMARPPGKRNSTIHLLSGGEKALTAVALLFAFFDLNPAPFCILDEVDAPLDDANVERYTELLNTLSDRTQLIFITHNKITMESAHILIGVTMMEPGVSRLVSVDVEEAVQMAAQ